MQTVNISLTYPVVSMMLKAVTPKEGREKKKKSSSHTSSPTDSKRKKSRSRSKSPSSKKRSRRSRTAARITVAIGNVTYGILAEDCLSFCAF